MDFLTSEQNERFAAINARLGLGPAEYTAQLPAGKFVALSSVRTMSSTRQSDFPFQVISIGSVEQMRAMVGIANEHVLSRAGSPPDYPVPPPVSEIERILNAIKHGKNPEIVPQLMERIKQALVDYVVGDPARVGAFVPLINATQFPSRAAVFTGETLNVPDGATHVIAGDDPVVLNYGKITVGKGATIKLQTGTFINSQIFEQEQGEGAAAAADTYTIVDIGENYNTAADKGGTGPTGDPNLDNGVTGESSYSSSNCKYNCTREPGNGKPGNPGKKGLVGAPGAKGRPSAGGIHNLGLITTPITILVGAGDGQQGGKGGDGGAGGAGSLKGNAANGCKNEATNGPQGQGGQGGDGGRGGDGGESGYLTVYYYWNGPGEAPIKVTVRTVGGGAGGLPGDPGQGNGNQGQGGTQGRGNQGPIPKVGLNRQ